MRTRALPEWVDQLVVLIQIVLTSNLIVLATLGGEGWDGFARSVGISFVVQMVIALILLRLLQIALALLGDRLPFRPSQRLLAALAALLALPFLRIALARSLDVYDLAQTLFVAFDLYLLVEVLGDALAGMIRRLWPERRSPRKRAPGADRALYRNLLNKVRDRETAERLVAYERSRAPHADRDELVRRAIERWERDNRSWRG